MLDIMVSAGEVSGDKNAAAVIRKLQEIYGDIAVWGLGGRELAGAGAEIIHNTVENSVVGILEPLVRLRYYIGILNDARKKIIERKPSLILLVDFTAFNMKLAKFAYRYDIPVISYFSPSAWVWGKRRAVKMARWKAVIAAVFRMEYDVYEKAGAEVYFAGHPLPYDIRNRVKNNLGNYGIDTGKRMVGLLPGSRRQEIEALLVHFLRAAGIIHKNCPDTVFVIPAAAPHLKTLIEDITRKTGINIPVFVLDGLSLDVMEKSQVVLMASGTAALEAACIGTPYAAAYRVSYITGLFIRLFVKVKYMSLPNIILNEPAFPEFYQKKVGAEALAAAALAVLNDGAYAAGLREKLSEAVSCLGEDCAAEKVARLIADVLEV